MNYITSCPKCDTQFLLNDELIKVHRGKVQCGSCELVFNAKTRLTEVADDITSTEEYQASIEEQASSETQLDENIEEIIIESDLSDSDIDNAEIDDYISSTSTASATIASPSAIDDFNKHVSKPRKAKQRNKHPILLGAVSLLLVLAAALQTIYHMRVKIAAEYPQFKPLLVKACTQFNCTIGLPKDLDFITIGDSDMQENDSYQSVINFTSSLTNTANYPQAFPSIVLTLTNANNNVVIKKLIHPEDYLPADKKIEDGLTGRGVHLIKLPLYVHEAAVAGYRILLIYR